MSDRLEGRRQELGLRVSDDLAERLVDAHPLPAHPRKRHPDWRVIERTAQQRFSVAELLFGALSLGDVLHLRERVQQRASLIANDSDGEREPDDVAVAVKEAALELNAV